MSATEFPSCVDEFFADFKVQKLLDLARETRPLQVCFPREVPISRFLAWVLDPSQGHGLQDMPIRRMLTAAWRNREAACVDLAVKRQISPSALSTYSFLGTVIQKEARLTADSGQLDVLILHPKEKLLVAVENKFGAGQSAGQLKKYRKALEKRYPDWTRVLIFLDRYGETPHDDYWIGLDYEWLVEELRNAESSPWLAAEPKSVIREFRQVIELDGDTFTHLDVDDEVLLDIVKEHRPVIEHMAGWHRSRHKLPELVETVFQAGATLHDKACQQLFHAFWQRSELWRICISMLAYAGVLATVKKRFPSVIQDPYRKAFFYALPEWDVLSGTESESWTLHVMVKILPPREDDNGDIADNKFVVVSTLEMHFVADERRDTMRGLAERLRAKYMERGHKLTDEPGRTKLRVDKVSGEDEAAAKLIEHLAMLNTELARSERNAGDPGR